MRNRSSITRSSTCIRSSYIAWVAALLIEVRGAAPGFHREVCDQLDRASLSSLLNTAEGNGKRQGKQRAKFFDDARGSAVECAACLDALAAKTLVTKARIAEGKALLLRIDGMLTKLVERQQRHIREMGQGESEGEAPAGDGIEDLGSLGIELKSKPRELQVMPPLDNAQITDRGFLVEGRLGYGWHLSGNWDFGLVAPVSWGYFFKNRTPMGATDVNTHYQGAQVEVLAALRLNIGLF